MAKKTYVMYLKAGTLFVDHEYKKVSSRNLASAKRNMPLHAFAFFFYDQTEVEMGGELLRGQARNQSVLYYPDAKLWTATQLKKMGPPKYRSGLYSKAKDKGGKLLQCRAGNWQPFDEKTCRII